MQALSVTGLLVQDHERIESLLDDFKKTKHKQTKKKVQIFNELAETLRRHFNQEAILYSKYKHLTGEILPILQTVHNEHIEMNEHIERIGNAIRSEDDNVDTSGFFALLVRHRNIEERNLYPELDNVLSDKEKEEVYWKLKVR
ncbi:MAG: hemerythrin domain-containing protein [Nanoarchaeota archaeon]|nr:hemerythrin domain-containing protein [Nanoarchaeota archaeon]